MTWAKWGAVDRYKAENPQLLLGVERPITPPTDDERGVALSTPRAVTPLLPANATVPGQPRKTPGAKTRHAVSAPETVDPINDDVFADQLHMQGAQKRAARARSRSSVRETSATPSAPDRTDEAMQLVVDEVLIMPISHRRTVAEDGDEVQNSENDAPPRAAYIANSQGIREITPPSVTDGNGNSLLNGQQNGSNATNGKGISAPRIGKPRQQRPLTTITDNRQVDKIPTLAFTDAANSSTCPSSGVPKNKGIPASLGTVYEDNSHSSSTERYNLRAGRSGHPLINSTNTSSMTNNAASTTTFVLHRPTGPHHTSSSPSRLPRVAKSKGGGKFGAVIASIPDGPATPVTRSVSGSRKANGGVNIGAVNVAAADPGTNSVRLSRNVRRRRSSTGDV